MKHSPYTIGATVKGASGQASLQGDVTTSCGKTLRKSGYYYVMLPEKGATLCRFSGVYLPSGAAEFATPGQATIHVVSKSADIRWIDREELVVIFPQWAR